MNLISSFENLTPSSFETTWRSPSNIAFVKYWGKKGRQLPANPSLSMTLKECYTETNVQFGTADSLSVDLFLDGNKEDKFAAKIKTYLETLTELPWIKNLSVKVQTRNTFPHGTGIASSASGLSAFALCLTDYLYSLSHEKNDELFYKNASYLSRLASGSACRSVYGGFTTWGEFDESGSSDLYASSFEVHPDLAHLKDSVLVVSGKEKSVSSTAGHGQMKDHAFAEARFVQAKNNFHSMASALKSGDVEQMGRIMESEALSLHAMMLTSPDAYTLLRPNTLVAIEMIWAFRRETKLPLYFTLDAGPNLHLIYPEIHQHKIKTFISHELSPLAQKIIEDERGEGPQKC
jgi:diphosphomevalonate decarboxylase